MTDDEEQDTKYTTLLVYAWNPNFEQEIRRCIETLEGYFLREVRIYELPNFLEMEFAKNEDENLTRFYSKWELVEVRSHYDLPGFNTYQMNHPVDVYTLSCVFVRETEVRVATFRQTEINF